MENYLCRHSNIFVTAPSPENLKTLFEFVCKGLSALDYKEFDVVKSANPAFNKAIERINIYKHHRQTIQYILPHEHEKLSQVELLVVDEAAAIPLPVVKSLLGPYLVFLSSTVNGNDSAKRTDGTGSGFKKIELSESIRYASGDPIENWLDSLLCLNVSNAIPNLSRLPPCSECDLYYVNRDTLFSHHKDSELFLQQMMSLYVASHYKNSPNDLQLMSDAPAHHLFVLLGAYAKLVVWIIALECYLDSELLQFLGDHACCPIFCVLWFLYVVTSHNPYLLHTGARIVRIATHPSAMRLGYGSQAVELLIRASLYIYGVWQCKMLEAPFIGLPYFEGQLTPISEMDVEPEIQAPRVTVSEAAEKVSLLEETTKPRTDLPHLLVDLRERRPEKLHYIGVSFGLTLDLFSFWRKLKFSPFYIGQIPNTVTGEHSCMVLRHLNNDEIEVDGSNYQGFYQDFRRKFTTLLSSTFRDMEYKLAMRIMDPKINFTKQDYTTASVREYLYPLDMKLIKAYVGDLSEFGPIEYLVPILAEQYFQEKLPVELSALQASVLLCMGLQRQNISHFEDDMKSNEEALLPPELLQRYAIEDGGSAFESVLQKNGGKISTSGLIAVKSSKTGAKLGKDNASHKRGTKRGKDHQSHKISKRRS
ncbi:hypothetical protein TSUD_379130 [Trifolium subterraneum]|uniref:N-acetyltransferase domain-containing protein n=1 Tax=Trifolium subterraneum TaxID=3900 RepID=A0A2Z6NJQ6_TRISU|nr:hypothetical protein TSUD_379130 [Trifolium subterraneum]